MDNGNPGWEIGDQVWVGTIDLKVGFAFQCRISGKQPCGERFVYTSQDAPEGHRIFSDAWVFTNRITALRETLEWARGLMNPATGFGTLFELVKEIESEERECRALDSDQS